MFTHRRIEKICAACMALALLVCTAMYVVRAATGIDDTSGRTMGYEETLFDTSTVHTIDIVMDDWDSFIEGCEDEEYVNCSVIIDGEAVKNVGIRAKGNTSLSNVSQLGSTRYSFKIEFDQYELGKNYYGLDKLSLNNIIQDNTYMKDYLCYTMMGAFGVDAPLASYAYITVNGADWGLYLAVEGVEDSFLERNYGSQDGNLYKPDSMSFGAGRGNGAEFTMAELTATEESGEEGEASAEQTAEQSTSATKAQAAEQTGAQAAGEATSAGGEQAAAQSTSATGEVNAQGPGRGGGGNNASADVKLQYIDDDPDSYQNIFDNASTTVTAADKLRLIESLRKLSAGEDLDEVLDMDEVLRYFVVHDFVCNDDSYTGNMIHNYYLYETDGKLSMIPWDYNLAFGGFAGGEASSQVNSPIDDPVSSNSGPGAGGGFAGNAETSGTSDASSSSAESDSRPMVDWIFSNEAYTQAYHELYQQFINEIDIQTIISETAELIAPYVEKDPSKFCTYEEFESGVETLKTFCELRVQSVQCQLNGSIPSTEEGQQEDSSSLIDASAIQLSTMGSMGNTGGGQAGGQGMQNAAQTGEEAQQESARTGSDVTQGEQPGQTQDGSAPSEEGGMPPSGTAPTGTPPSGTPPDGATPPSGTAPGEGTPPSTTSTNEDGTNSGDASTGESRPTPPTMPSGEGFTPPEGMQTGGGASAASSTLSAQDLVAVGVCIAALIGGIAVAFIFRRP